MADNSTPAISPNDLDIVARTLIGEDPTPAGRAAVAHVMFNRLKSGDFGANIPAIAYSPDQFESWTTRSGELMKTPTNSPDYQQAYSIAKGVANGDIPDPTGGATQFLNPTLQKQMGRKIPAWAKGQPSAVIGHQTYYAAPGKGSAPMSDEDIGALWGGQAVPKAKPMTDEDIGAL